MSSVIPAWVVLIDKSTTNYPLYVKNILVDHKILWNYIVEDEPGFEYIVKDILGVDKESPVVFYTYCDYLIHPITGEVMREDGGDTLGEFMMKAHARHVDLVKSAGRIMLSAAMA